jgi:hypothetical protein
MATKKKTKKRPTKSKKSVSKKTTPRKKLAKKKAAPKKAAGKKATVAKKVATRRRTPARRQGASAPAFSPERAGELSGDLQGLSNREAADSESVDELLEEGNAFEADAVGGVESADDADEQEVHTHEVPEDDVPAEYLDEE